MARPIRERKKPLADRAGHAGARPMAVHESHERHCPHCGAGVSATVPKCLNCGRYVNEEEDEAAAEAAGRTRMGWFIAPGAAAVVVVLIVALSLG